MKKIIFIFAMLFACASVNAAEYEHELVTNCVKGVIKNVAVWNRALTPEEIEEHRIKTMPKEMTAPKPSIVVPITTPVVERSAASLSYVSTQNVKKQ